MGEVIVRNIIIHLQLDTFQLTPTTIVLSLGHFLCRGRHKRGEARRIAVAIHSTEYSFTRLLSGLLCRRSMCITCFILYEERWNGQAIELVPTPHFPVIRSSSPELISSWPCVAHYPNYRLLLLLILHTSRVEVSGSYVRRTSSATSSSSWLAGWR